MDVTQFVIAPICAGRYLISVLSGRGMHSLHPRAEKWNDPPLFIFADNILKNHKTTFGQTADQKTFLCLRFCL